MASPGPALRIRALTLMDVLDESFRIYRANFPVFAGLAVIVNGLNPERLLLAGSYLRFVSRRIEARPEDREDAEVSDGAGELGFFSPGSYWPIALAASAATAGLALAFFYVWLLLIAVAMLLVAIGGLVFEYHTGPNHD